MKQEEAAQSQVSQHEVRRDSTVSSISMIVSMNSPKAPLHISLPWNSDVDWQIRQTHFEYDTVKKKSPPPVPDGSVKFLVSYLVQLPHSFLYPFFEIN